MLQFKEPLDFEVFDLGDRNDQLLSEIQSLRAIVVKEFRELRTELALSQRIDFPFLEAVDTSPKTAKSEIAGLPIFTRPQSPGPMSCEFLDKSVPLAGIDEDAEQVEHTKDSVNTSNIRHSRPTSFGKSHTSTSSNNIASTNMGTLPWTRHNAGSTSDLNLARFPVGPSWDAEFEALKKRATTNALVRRAAKVNTDDADAVAAALGKFDPEQMKLRVHTSLVLPRHDLGSRPHGCFQKIAMHHYFEYVSISVIFTNAIWIAVETDNNNAGTIFEATFVYVLAHLVFYLWFVAELFIRFMAYEQKKLAFRDGWFLLDMALVLLYTFDPFVLGLVDILVGGTAEDLPIGVLRLLRVARLSRLTHLFWSFPELVIMIRATIAARATVGYALFCLGLTTYTFAIAIRSLTPADSTIERMYFPTILETMHHLFIHGAFLDSLSTFMLQIKSESVPIMVLSWLYIALSASFIMNMLIGILCQVISAVATEEKKTILVRQVRKEFTDMWKQFDKDRSGSLTWEQFVELLSDEKVQVALTRVDVNIEALIDMTAEIFFYDHGGQGEAELTYEEFIDLLLNLRGSQPASVKDVLTTGKRLNAKVLEMRAMLEFIARNLGKTPNAKYSERSLSS